MQATKIVVAVGVSLAFLASAASAHGPYTVTLAALKPTGVGCIDAGGLPCFGNGGASAFFDVSRGADPATQAPLECGLRQAGANNADCRQHTQHHHHPFAVGTCTVQPGNPKVGSTSYVFLCGTDRNDDGFITALSPCGVEDDTAPHGVLTNHDECSGESAVTNGGAGEDYADDWVEGDNILRTVSFCFQDDVRGFTHDPADDSGRAGEDVSGLNQAVFPVEHGDGWDDIIVIVAAGTGAPRPPNVGAATVTLEIRGTDSCGIVSAHNSSGNTVTDQGRDSPECADSIDNDGDGGIDSADPNCHTDGNAANLATYDAADNSES